MRRPQRMALSEFHRRSHGDSTEEGEVPLSSSGGEEDDELNGKVVLPSYWQLHEISVPAGPRPDEGADELTKAAYERSLQASKRYGKAEQAASIPDRYRDGERWLWQMMCHQAAEFKHRVGSTLHDLHHGVYKTDPGEEHAWVQCKITEADDFSACVELNESDQRIWKRLRKDNVDLENPVPEKRHTKSSWWEGWILEVEGHKVVVYADEGEIGVTELSATEELFTGSLHLLFLNGRPPKLKAPKSLRLRPVDFIRPAINHYKSTATLHKEVQATVYRPVKDLLAQIANPNTGPGQKAQEVGLRAPTWTQAAPPGSFYGIIARLPGGLSAIQGPPGTGKSTAVKTIITERVPIGTKALVVCVKNKAVDAVVDKLKDVPGGVVVFGSNRSLGPEAVKHRYDLKAERHPEWVSWVSLVRQLKELRVALKKGCEDAQDMHRCTGTHKSSSGPNRTPPRAINTASAASASPERERSRLSELEICQELCCTGAAPAQPGSISDEEEGFMGGCADSEDEAELAGMAASKGAEHSSESPDMLANQHYSTGPFKLCLDDDPAVSVSEITEGIMLTAPSIQCGAHVWEQSRRSPVEVLLCLRDALLLLFSKLGEPNSRGKREAEGNLHRTMTELRDLAASPQKLRTAAEVQQFELDRLNHFMAYMAHEAAGGSMLKKVAGHAMRDVLEQASAFMSTIDTVPTLFGVLEKCHSTVGGSIKTVIVDEAGCVPEYEMPILLSFSPVTNLILIGDHHQLPCFSRIDVFDQNKHNMTNHSRSLLERMVKCGAPVPMLVVQYRMAQQISDVVSRVFYDKGLLTGTVAPSRLQPLKWVEAPMASPGQPKLGPRDPVARQRYETNPAEAELAMKVALEVHDRLLDQGISHPTVYVIAPYNRQVELMEELLKERRSKRASKLDTELARHGIDSSDLISRDKVQHLLTQRGMNRDFVGSLQDRKYQLELKGIMVLTVDKAQGSEADAAVLSTVKCGKFTQDPRRMCVALSRARQQSVLVGNTAEMQQHPMWQRIISAYKGGA